MNRPLSSTLWIFITATVLVAALIPFDAQLSGYARGLPEAVVAFNRTITDFGTFRWMIYGSGSLAIVAFVVHGASRSETVAGRARTASRLFSYFFVTIGSASALVHLLKTLIGRARPEMLVELGAYSLTPFSGDSVFESFPSGHSAAVGSFFGAFALLVPQLRPLFLAAALLIGVSRVIVGAHYPSDVAAGLLVGLWCAVMAAFLFARLNVLFRLDAAGWPRPKLDAKE
ncbi:MAG TPA: phosphatase PAP2 family protein [Mycoplana sp.]|jgi:membrane-associated phospholipid phosphatase|nr:phosphatase PAP2 family protein [Mycoplana sp.]